MTTPVPGAAPAPEAPSAPDQQPQPDIDADTQPDQQAQSQPQPDTDAVDAADQDDDNDQDDDSDSDQPEDGKDREAAKYRKKYQAARDDLVTQRAAFGMQQQAFVDHIVTEAGYDSAQFGKLLETTIEFDSLLDPDSGLVDPDRVRDAIAETARSFGVRPPSRPRPTPGQGKPVGEAAPGWHEVLSGKR